MTLQKILPNSFHCPYRSNHRLPVRTRAGPHWIKYQIIIELIIRKFLSFNLDVINQFPKFINMGGIQVRFLITNQHLIITSGQPGNNVMMCQVFSQVSVYSFRDFRYRYLVIGIVYTIQSFWDFKLSSIIMDFLKNLREIAYLSPKNWF